MNLIAIISNKIICTRYIGNVVNTDHKSINHIVDDPDKTSAYTIDKTPNSKYDFALLIAVLY